VEAPQGGLRTESAFLKFQASDVPVVSAVSEILDISTLSGIPFDLETVLMLI
jgi:hypothetical protein